MRLEKREMAVVKLGHDEYLVRPVDEFLRDPSDGESARAGGSRFVLFRREDIRPEDYGSGRIVEGQIVNGRIVDSPGHFYKFEQKRVDNKIVDEMVMLNTGIVRSYSIISALNFIKLHPNGPR